MCSAFEIPWFYTLIFQFQKEESLYRCYFKLRRPEIRNANVKNAFRNFDNISILIKWLSKLMLNIAKSHPSMFDINPPELLFYELSDYTIDLSGGDVSLDVTARIQDDLSGVY